MKLSLETGSQSDLEVILNFISSLLWPAVVLIALFLFKGQITALLTRLSSLKVGDTEVAFQTPSVDAKDSSKVLNTESAPTGAGGFLTETGIRNLVRESGTLDGSDEIYRSFPIFSTSKQNTWLAFSRRKVICILDDEKTRASGRLIQWVSPKTEATPVKCREYKDSVGLLDIGQRTSWLYSTRLFPSPATLEEEVRSALDEQS
jgi:hypothetical protein